MNWVDIYNEIVGDYEKITELMVCAWMALDQSDDIALKSNAIVNMMSPSDICWLLDTAGIPAPDIRDDMNYRDGIVIELPTS